MTDDEIKQALDDTELSIEIDCARDPDFQQRKTKEFFNYDSHD